MGNRKLHTLALLVFTIGYLNAISQSKSGMAQVYQRETISVSAFEKCYLQFDKSYYAIGDTIFFKGYITVGADHKLSALSGVLHAELINPNGKLIRSESLQMAAGTAWGDFVLADTLKSGKYYIRAYTNWMRNEGEDSFFEKEIPVGSLASGLIPESSEQKRKSTLNKPLSLKPDVQFMAEGGSLVAGNYSRIAFKAIGIDGLSRNIKGTITDETGSEITSFASTHAGIGSFTLVSQTGKTYKANIIFDDGSKDVIELPQPTEKGYTISMNNNSADTLRIRVTAGISGITDKLRLVAMSQGTVYYAAENQQMGAKFFSAVIPKSKFPTGIVQFTLLSANGEPLNERLVFINNNELKININTEKNNYQIRQKIKLNLNTEDKTKKPETGSFSVSVMDETKVPLDTTNEDNLLSYLLLTSDLKGNIENPAYYFSNTNEQTRADLDNLLLTQGYRHFEWKQEPQYQPEKAFTISGTTKKDGKPAAGAKVSLVSKTGGFFMIDTVSDSNGRFAFKNLVFADSTKFLVQSKVTKGQDDVTVELDTLPAPSIINLNTTIKTHKKDEEIYLAKYIINQKQFYEEQKKYGINQHSIILKEVHVEAKKESLIPHSENLNGPGHADQVLTAADIQKYLCGSKLADCLRGVLTRVGFDKNGVPNKGVAIDGTFVDPEMFADLNADDIEGIENITGPHYGAIYGSRGAGPGNNGILIITTKRAKKTNTYYRYAPGVVTYMPQGFYKAREFYSPQYDNPKTNQKMADLRSTIYWNPNIITDKDGKATFSYFNADGKGTYRVVVEGIDADGNLGRQVYRYKVE